MTSSERPHTTLIDAGELDALLASRTALVVLDTSFDLADPGAGERAFAEGHVPGARYAHLDRDLSGPKTGRNGRHPLPDRAALAAWAGRMGIGPDTQVVAYDAQGGMFAARAWWLLRWLGHQAVAVLDGGLQAWREAAGRLEAGAEQPATDRGPYPERPSLAAWIDADTVAARMGRSPIVDARAPDRYRGESEPLDAKAGHIPGAMNRFFKENLAAGRFKPPARLREEFGTLLGTARPEDVVHQCGSGVTACHNLLAMEHAGLRGSLLYPGSWSEWSSDPARPVAVGG